MKLIVLILGLVLGFGGGIWYGVQHPEWAKGVASKEEEWVKKGKEEALKQVKEKLDSILAKSSASSPTPPSGRSFIGGSAGGGSSSATDDLKALRGDVEQQLTQLK